MIYHLKDENFFNVLLELDLKNNILKKKKYISYNIYTDIVGSDIVESII